MRCGARSWASWGTARSAPRSGYWAKRWACVLSMHGIEPRLSHGNCRPRASLQDLLRESDFVTLHVPATDQTQRMIGEAELGCMKRGSYLLNASRGGVVDLVALREA